ncbi:peptidase [Alkalinema sp. FACHB-956]|uniref:peptidase n=1 Tax=Alkalinema sp. FACHB-956 TaxID=2692768 RepID=UPI0018F031A6|nr:peptidase [Alkalinema sp. FACHB-956]
MLIRAFRRYHRVLALITCIPFFLTTITGMAYPILSDWLGTKRFLWLLMRIHTGELFGIQAIYPVLNGLGSLGLLVTGLSMMGVFRRSKSSTPAQ